MRQGSRPYLERSDSDFLYHFLTNLKYISNFEETSQTSWNFELPEPFTYCDPRLYICLPITCIITPACGIAVVAGAQRHKVFETLQTFIAPKFLLSHLCIKITRFIKSTWSCLELFHQKKFSFHFWTFTKFSKLYKLWWTQNTSYIFCASKWIDSEIQFEVV
jgi:hypothetical protein